jgi:hypothetical protein
VSWDPDQPEVLPRVWLCEVTEAGASMCGLSIRTKNRAMANACFNSSDVVVGKSTWEGNRVFGGVCSSNIVDEEDAAYLKKHGVQFKEEQSRLDMEEADRLGYWHMPRAE